MIEEYLDLWKKIIINGSKVGIKYYISPLVDNSSIKNSKGPIKNSQNPKLIKEIKKVTPMNRLVSYDNLFGLLEFLINDQSKFITGQNIFVDGGRTII